MRQRPLPRTERGPYGPRDPAERVAIAVPDAVGAGTHRAKAQGALS
jgi:hypothetical protein